jgi:hypothetical protein
VLVFPADVAEFAADLRAAGIAVGAPVPSVVVRERLARRYPNTACALDVTILRAPITAADGMPCEIEIFAAPAPPGHALAEVIARERANSHESHVALRLRHDGRSPADLASLLTTRGGLTADGGGYNVHVDTTLRYFRAGNGDRLEVMASGYHR